MSRNDQVTRQWHILQILERPGGATIEEIAAALPADFSRNPRTVRRDLDVLAVTFPIYSDRVDGHVRWKVLEGSKGVPDLHFSATELMALICSRDLLKPLEGTLIKDAMDSVLAKATNALPASADEYVKDLQKWFGVGFGSHKRYAAQREMVEQLSRAIRTSRTVEMSYHTASRIQTTRRKADPYRLWFAAGGLYLIAYCHLRRDIRTFAVDRIRSLTVTNRPCQMPLGFDIEAYMRDALVVMRGPQIDVRLRFDRATSEWAKDRIWHSSQRASMGKDSCLSLELKVADTPELVGWLLGFGSGVRIESPDSLRDKVVAAAQAIVANAEAEPAS